MIVVGTALGLLTVWLEKHHVGAQGEPWNLSPLDRCLLAGRILWFYAGKLAWPSKLLFVYPRWRIDSADNAMLLCLSAVKGRGAAMGDTFGQFDNVL